MESRFCVLSDTEDLQMLISNTAANLHTERWVESRCWFITILVPGFMLGLVTGT